MGKLGGGGSRLLMSSWQGGGGGNSDPANEMENGGMGMRGGEMRDEINWKEKLSWEAVAATFFVFS
eukprot:746104-Hanusia_phi.AAC.1